MISFTGRHILTDIDETGRAILSEISEEGYGALGEGQHVYLFDMTGSATMSADIALTKLCLFDINAAAVMSGYVLYDMLFMSNTHMPSASTDYSFNRTTTTKLFLRSTS